MPAPALSVVVIFLRATGLSVLTAPLPAPGLLLDEPPVFIVNGAIAGVIKFAPMTLSALIWLHQLVTAQHFEIEG